ncbi:NAD(P)/FAD-dependent oxidoreductase [Citricoccus sp.]|uniref:flavin monoamine oxidase family protein n=1 Tax=Citricoccus sp. TaxID=1978372 RepID=UPI0028BECD52|nr:NAD(P)/FAD-dependent oxidoreductase [Citricoccus sp.]
MRHAHTAKAHSGDVIVIGAGMAGLGAAREMSDAGRNVVVLEARNRIGGRLWTDHSCMGIPVERGAELVHGSEASTWQLITGGGLPTHRLATHMVRHGPRHTWLRIEDPEIRSFPHSRPLLPDPLPRPLTQETALAYLMRLGVEPGNIPLALRLVETDTEQLHALAASEIAELLNVTFDGRESDGSSVVEEAADFRVPGGYDRVATAVAAGLDIRTGAVVRAVRCRSGGVEVVTSERVFFAQAVVVAVPAGVLQTGMIEFSPSLPSGQRDDIQSVEYLPVYKGLFEFSRPVLPVGWDVAEDPSLAVPCFWNASAGTSGYRGEVVVAWATGDHARHLLALDRQHQQATALEALGSMLGETVLSPIAMETHNWAADPFARGAYPGPLPLPEGIDDPLEGRVFWAGLVTETIHESYDSGRRAGQQALTSLH